jgi:hypothetical protein
MLEKDTLADVYKKYVLLRWSMAIASNEAVCHKVNYDYKMLILKAENWGRTYMATTTNAISGGMPYFTSGHHRHSHRCSQTQIHYYYYSISCLLLPVRL